MQKAVLILLVVVVVTVIFLYFWNKVPKARIFINKDGSGTATLGDKAMDFPKGMGVVLTSWNQYRFAASSDSYTLAKFSKTISRTDKITPYDGGSSYVDIIRN